MEIILNEDTSLWEKKEEAYATVETATEKDYKRFCEMVEKNIAKKPIGQNLYGKTGGHIFKYVCPNCEKFLTSDRVLKMVKESGEFKTYMPKYCPECGSKIDWSEFEE